MQDILENIRVYIHLRSYGHLGDNIYSVLYDGVNENGLQSIIYLKVWSTVGGSLWEGLIVALLKEVSHCKYTWRIQNPITVPVSILSSSLPHIHGSDISSQLLLWFYACLSAALHFNMMVMD